MNSKDDQPVPYPRSICNNDNDGIPITGLDMRCLSLSIRYNIKKSCAFDEQVTLDWGMSTLDNNNNQWAKYWQIDWYHLGKRASRDFRHFL